MVNLLVVVSFVKQGEEALHCKFTVSQLASFALRRAIMCIQSLKIMVCVMCECIRGRNNRVVLCQLRLSGEARCDEEYKEQVISRLCRFL